MCLEGCIILPQRLKSTLFEIFSLNNLVISQPAGIIDNDQAKIGFHFNFIGVLCEGNIVNFMQTEPNSVE